MVMIFSELCRRSVALSAGATLSLFVFCGGLPNALAKLTVGEAFPKEIDIALAPLSEMIGETIGAQMPPVAESLERWIEINLADQRLIAWEGEKQVYAIVISSGKGETPTRVGDFTIKSKHRYSRMRGADYDVPNVPYTMYYDGGYAIHGAYWHRRFGTPVSHGCVNLAVNHAKWLFDWAEVGTPVVIRK